MGGAIRRDSGDMVIAVHPRTRTTAVASAPCCTTVRLPSLRHFGPNWYATVMGTAIVANAGVALPYDVPGLRTVCAASGRCPPRCCCWSCSPPGPRTGCTTATRPARHLLDPAMAPFYGCLSMALLAVGSGTLTVGQDVIGEPAAVAVACVLFVVGTLIGLAAAVAVPYLMVVRHRVAPGTASPVWLLPVVSPMVAASLGPLLVPHLPAGQWRRGAAAGVLRHVRHQPAGHARDPADGPVPAGAPRAAAARAHPDALPGPRPARPVHHRRRQARGRGPGRDPGAVRRGFRRLRRASTASR